MKGFYRDVVEELSPLGFARSKGGKGSHEKWVGGQPVLTILVPRNLMSRHTANGIMKTAGSPRRF